MVEAVARLAILWQARIQDFLQGGGGGQRRSCTAGAFGARADGGSRVDKHQIKVHSVHRIFRAIFVVVFFAIVKKFVEKKNWWSRAGGGGHDPPPWIRPCMVCVWLAELAKTASFRRLLFRRASNI